ncbi:hypothetical protein AOA80_04230 [Methanomassiliicoccales archaeon RumEn M1]|nr:hypothetical protein AOA80_04230 [Methanomassiliicoccales archaeon RumEn M1]
MFDPFLGGEDAQGGVQKDDPKKLDFAMNWGDQLVRAYAATISLAEAGKVPYLAAGRTPMGDVSYAVRGKVEKDKLIGVQNFDHPELRLMAFWKIAERENLHMYSMEDHVFCSPDGPSPPGAVRGGGDIPAPVRPG